MSNMSDMLAATELSGLVGHFAPSKKQRELLSDVQALD